MSGWLHWQICSPCCGCEADLCQDPFLHLQFSPGIQHFAISIVGVESHPIGDDETFLLLFNEARTEEESKEEPVLVYSRPNEAELFTNSKGETILMIEMTIEAGPPPTEQDCCVVQTKIRKLVIVLDVDGRTETIVFCRGRGEEDEEVLKTNSLPKFKCPEITVCNIMSPIIFREDSEPPLEALAEGYEDCEEEDVSLDDFDVGECVCLALGDGIEDDFDSDVDDAIQSSILGCTDEFLELEAKISENEDLILDLDLEIENLELQIDELDPIGDEAEILALEAEILALEAEINALPTTLEEFGCTIGDIPFDECFGPFGLACEECIEGIEEAIITAVFDVLGITFEPKCSDMNISLSLELLGDDICEPDPSISKVVIDGWVLQSEFVSGIFETEMESFAQVVIGAVPVGPDTTCDPFSVAIDELSDEFVEEFLYDNAMCATFAGCEGAVGAPACCPESIDDFSFARCTAIKFSLFDGMVENQFSVDINGESVLETPTRIWRSALFRYKGSKDKVLSWEGELTDFTTIFSKNRAAPLLGNIAETCGPGGTGLLFCDVEDCTSDEDAECDNSGSSFLDPEFGDEVGVPALCSLGIDNIEASLTGMEDQAVSFPTLESFGRKDRRCRFESEKDLECAVAFAPPAPEGSDNLCDPFRIPPTPTECKIIMNINKKVVDLLELVSFSAIVETEPEDPDTGLPIPVKFRFEMAITGTNSFGTNVFFALPDQLESFVDFIPRVPGFFFVKVSLLDEDGNVLCFALAKTLEVRFPRAVEVEADSAVRSVTDASWERTKARVGSGRTHREEGFFVLLDTSSGAYNSGPLKLGPLVSPCEGATVNLGSISDFETSIFGLSPFDSGMFVVIDFHTHPGTHIFCNNSLVFFAAGPSDPDVLVANILKLTAEGSEQGLPGIVFDFFGVFDQDLSANFPIPPNELLPSQPRNFNDGGDPDDSINDPAKRFLYGPRRRATPDFR